ncbi:MAG: AAA family ATPase [Rhodoferax sp.]|uniref:ATP-binding protein n=1 Tax=Rhodoferax sp. TaxID=50421 RepID=UPI003BB635D1
MAETVRRLIVVAGPRQIGKTTAVHQVLRGRQQASYQFHAVDAPTPGANDLSTDFSIETAPDRLFRTGSDTATTRDEKWLIERWQTARQAARAWYNESMEALLAGKQPLAMVPDTAATPTPYALVFDEIQHIPNWSGVVKGLWDQDRAQGLAMHVVVLGSAPLLMQRGLSESLMGRFELLEMTHWSYSEMRDCFGFTLDQYIYFGGYPGPAPLVIQGQELRWRNEVLHSLIEPNLVKDILALARIEKPAVLRQLFELGCSYSGQIVALTKLLVQLNDAGNTTTLTHYLKLLRAAGLLAGLEKYAAQVIRQRAAPPKLNVLNTAFVSVYCGKTFAQARADHALWGHLVESSIGAHLLNSAADGMRVAYWRESPFEVDFVLQHGDRIAALEVKSAAHDQSARKGLRVFAEKHARLNIRTEVLGGDDFALADALTRPASHWLPEP